MGAAAAAVTVEWDIPYECSRAASVVQVDGHDQAFLSLPKSSSGPPPTFRAKCALSAESFAANVFTTNNLAASWLTNTTIELDAVVGD